MRDSERWQASRVATRSRSQPRREAASVAADVEAAERLGRLPTEMTTPGASARVPIRTPPVDEELARSVDWQALDDLDEDPRHEDELELSRSLILGDVIRTFGSEYRQRYWRTMTTQQDRVLREVAACYTPLMGTHEWTCDDCGTVVEIPNALQQSPLPHLW